MKKIIVTLAYIATLLNVMACSDPKEEIIVGGNTPNYSEYEEWSATTLNAIDRDLKIAGTNSYYENQNRDHISFIWGNIFHLYAYVQGTGLNSEMWKQNLVQCIANSDSYWTTGYNNKNGYATLPTPVGTNPDRYYDENGWMSIGLSDAYMVTKNEDYLEKAKNALAFTLSGEDDVLGGGIYFQETFSMFKPQKNTICSAVAIIAAMKLYGITKDELYLETAKRLSTWTTENLLDRSDNLLWDAKMVSDGSINKTKWSYNAGFMVQAWLLLYKSTNDKAYLNQAISTLASAESKWFNGKSGALNDPGYFAFTIIDAWYAFFELTGDKSYLSKAFLATEFVNNHLKDANGRYPEHWGTATSEPLKAWDLRFSTVVAYTYMKAAAYKEKFNSL